MLTDQNNMTMYIVDDDPLVCDMLADVTGESFTKVERFHRAQDFLDLRLEPNDIVLLDLQMPDIDGVETIRTLGQSNCPARLILISGYDESVLHSADGLARDYGLDVVADFIKPIDLNLLTALLEQLKKQVNDAVDGSDNQHERCFFPKVADLAHGIEAREFQFCYQPQVDLNTQQIYGVEALLRWHHPIHGILMPDKFIRIAEQSGLIVELTAMVIEMAVSQSVRWQQQNQPVRMSINISAQNIASLTMPEQLSQLAQHNQLDTRWLVLEITETALMSEVTTSLDILTRLRLKGFELSIDDFGTGYSSLSQLHRIPFTELKVDRSFVKEMMSDSQSLAIVETCIMLGHKLNMAVVAEGVEDQATLECLTTLGCDIAQGFHIAKPMLLDEFEAWRGCN